MDKSTTTHRNRSKAAAAMLGAETTTEAVQAEAVQAEAATVAEVAGKASVVAAVEEADVVANEAGVVVAAGTGVWMPTWDKAMEVGAWSTRRMSMVHLRRDTHLARTNSMTACTLCELL
jgi:hypothetical protein